MVDSIKPQIFGAHRSVSCVRSHRSLTSCYSMMQIGWSCAVIPGFLTEFLPLDALVLIHACWLLPILNSSELFSCQFFLFVCFLSFFFLLFYVLFSASQGMQSPEVESIESGVKFCVILLLFVFT